MEKKAQGLSLNMIIIAALGIIVLIVIVLVFKQGIGTTVKQYLGIGEHATSDISNEDKCERMFSNRVCRNNCDEAKGEKQVNYKCEDNKKCCEKQAAFT